MTLSWPWVWLLLPLWWLMPRLRRQTPALPLVLPTLTLPVTARWRHWPLRPADLAWLLLIAAISQPQWLGTSLPRPASGRDLLLLVDDSGSMGTPDLVSHGRYLPRIQAVNEALQPLLSARDGDRIALYLFGDKTYPLTPLTRDRQAVLRLLDTLEVGAAGNQTALGDALALTAQVLANAAAPQRVILLITDGRATAGHFSVDEGIDAAVRAGVRIHVLGVGSHDPRARQQLDETTLTRIANRTGGLYQRADSGEALTHFTQALDAQEPMPYDTPAPRRVTSLFAPLLLASLLCWLGSIRWRRPVHEH